MTDQSESADSLVAKAIESVLGAVPAGDTEEPPEGIAKYQPWADTVAPPSKNKRPLSELLAEYAARVAAEPEARAAMPSAKPPAVAFFDRFGSRRSGAEGEPAPGGGRGRRGRAGRRRGGASANEGAAPQRSRQGEPKPPQPHGAGRGPRGPARGGGPVQGAQPPVTAGEAGAAGRKRRRRRGGRGRSGGGTGSQPA